MANGRLLVLILVLGIVAALVWYDKNGGQPVSPVGGRVASDAGVARDVLRLPEDGGNVAEVQDLNAKPLDRMPNQTGSDPSLNPLARLPISALKATTERPLFAPRRQRPPPTKVVRRPPPAKPAKPKPTPPSVELLGILSDGGRAIAVLREGDSNRIIRVEPGDVVAGWRVSKINSSSIVFEHSEGLSSQVDMSRR